jgi:hypothetical protein
MDGEEHCVCLNDDPPIYRFYRPFSPSEPSEPSESDELTDEDLQSAQLFAQDVDWNMESQAWNGEAATDPSQWHPLPSWDTIGGTWV